MSHPTTLPVQQAVANFARRWSVKKGFSLIELIVVIIIIGFLVQIVLPFYPRAAREAARRMQCSNNLKQLALAMHNYHDTYKCLPPAYTVDDQGNRLHSWRTLLLPFLEFDHLYQKIDLTKPWNDPVNQAAVFGEKCPNVYLCASSSEYPKTHYMVVVDPESCFPGAESVAFKDIADGQSNTLLIIDGPEGSGVDWMSPYDADWSLLSGINEKTKLAHIGVIQVAMADGSVRAITSKSTIGIRRSLLTIAASDEPDYDSLDSAK